MPPEISLNRFSKEHRDVIKAIQKKAKMPEAPEETLKRIKKKVFEIKPAA